MPKVNLAWAIATFGNGLSIGTSFGASGIMLIDLALRLQPDIDIFYIDTGFFFPETHVLIDRLQQHYQRSFRRGRGPTQRHRTGRRAWPRALPSQPGPVLPSAQGRAAGNRAGRQYGMGYGHPPRPGQDPPSDAQHSLERALQCRQVSSIGRRARGGSVAVHPHPSVALQRIARPQLSQHRLLALHAPSPAG